MLSAPNWKYGEPDHRVGYFSQARLAHPSGRAQARLQIAFGGKIGPTANMRRKAFESKSGPATLGSTARAHLILHVWCWDCGNRADVDPGEQAERHGADLPVPD
jgi:hypothetical protein